MSQIHDATLAAFYGLRQTRQSLVAVVDAIPEAELTVIPGGFNNHVRWKPGHLGAILALRKVIS